jgi:hypothetical protein
MGRVWLALLVVISTAVGFARQGPPLTDFADADDAWRAVERLPAGTTIVVIAPGRDAVALRVEASDLTRLVAVDPEAPNPPIVFTRDAVTEIRAPLPGRSWRVAAFVLAGYVAGGLTGGFVGNGIRLALAGTAWKASGATVYGLVSGAVTGAAVGARVGDSRSYTVVYRRVW